MIKTNNDLIDVFFRKCKENNLKITPQRVAIYKELIKSKEHPSADAVYRKVIKIFPNISFDTINRTLLTFVDVGIANVVEGSGDPKRFDPDTGDHHHFRCIRCGIIIDFYSASHDGIEVPNEIRKQATVMNKKVVLTGFCNKCIVEKNI